MKWNFHREYLFLFASCAFIIGMFVILGLIYVGVACNTWKEIDKLYTNTSHRLLQQEKRV